MSKICSKYPIKSIEDPFAENDWLAWNKLMRSIKKVQIVGDDLYVTNLERLKKGFLNISSNFFVSSSWIKIPPETFLIVPG